MKTALNSYPFVDEDTRWPSWLAAAKERATLGVLVDFAGMINIRSGEGLQAKQVKLGDGVPVKELIAQTHDALMTKAQREALKIKAQAEANRNAIDQARRKALLELRTGGQFEADGTFTNGAKIEVRRQLRSGF